jgi:hypothetical protein
MKEIETGGIIEAGDEMSVLSVIVECASWWPGGPAELSRMVIADSPVSGIRQETYLIPLIVEG